MNTIVFAGGGTGGHIFPGLAVVDELRLQPDVEVAWIGSSSGMDRSIVENHGVRFYGVPSGKLRRYFSLRNAIDLFRIGAGFVASLAILMKIKPDLLFSKGGFVSVPPCYAASLLGIPVVTHECDLSPGLATRLNAKVADAIFVSFEDTVAQMGPKLAARVTVTGNPVRAAFYGASAERGRAFLGLDTETLPILFVQGGSLGARQINELVSETVDRLCERFVVVHQTGADNFDSIKYPSREEHRARYKPYPFIRAQMPDVLAAADLVLARSGANTVWECSVAGKPMILVPLAGSGTRGDQVENAGYFVNHGAAVMLSGKDVNAKSLLEAIVRLADSPDLRSTMSRNALALSVQKPAVTIASALMKMLRDGKGVPT